MCHFPKEEDTMFNLNNAIYLSHISAQYHSSTSQIWPKDCLNPTLSIE